MPAKTSANGLNGKKAVGKKEKPVEDDDDVNDDEIGVAAFRSLDADGTGTMDLEEFTELLEELNCNLLDEEIKQAYDTLDGDGNGVIDQNEFLVWWKNKSSDLDGDGEVGEIEEALARLKAQG